MVEQKATQKDFGGTRQKKEPSHSGKDAKKRLKEKYKEKKEKEICGVHRMDIPSTSTRNQ